MKNRRKSRSKTNAKRRVKPGKQIEKQGVSGWGGKRKGAGRKNLTKTVNHMKREAFDSKKPLQITVKLIDGLPNLRTKKMHDAFKKALVLAKAYGLRVLQYSLEKNHAHLVVECDSNQILGSAMKSFGSSFGKAVRKVAGGVGSVFKGRYHLSVLINPTKVRNSLKYVLLNRFKHENTPMDDNAFSSWRYFAYWPELLNRRRSAAWPDKFELPEYLCAPKSWLAAKGWLKVPV